MKQIERALSEIHIYAVFICSRSRPISGRGVIGYRPQLQMNVALQAKSVRIRYQDAIRTVLGGDLNFVGTSEAATLKGRVLIDSLSFTKNLPGTTPGCAWKSSGLTVGWETFKDLSARRRQHKRRILRRSRNLQNLPPRSPTNRNTPMSWPSATTRWANCCSKRARCLWLRNALGKRSVV